jgi:hypothetical protein
MEEGIINEKSIEVLNRLRSEGLKTNEIVEVLKKALNTHGMLLQSDSNSNELDCPFDFTSRCTMDRCNYLGKKPGEI